MYRPVAVFAALAVLATVAHAEYSGPPPSNLPQLNPAIVCDGTTDNAASIQAAINQIEALSPPGGTINLPPCNQIAVASNLLVNSSNVYLVGTGGTGPTGTTVSDSSYVGNAMATTVLKWTGAGGGTMLSFNPAAGGQSIKNGGAYGLVLAGMALAGLGLDIRSSDGVRVQNVTVENTTVTGINTNVTANVLQAQEVYDVQHGWFENVNILQVKASGAVQTTATCMVLDGSASPAADTSMMHFGHIFCRHQNGNGIVCNNADSNSFDDLNFFNPGGSTGYDVVLNKGSASTSGVACRYNHFKTINPSASSNGVYAFAPVGDAAPSKFNRMDQYRAPADNSSLALQAPQQDANGTETPALIFTTTAGITNEGPATSDNLLINGDFRIDQWHEGASVSLTGGTRAVTYIADRWRQQTGGLGGKLTGQELAAGPKGAASRSLKITTTTPATPTAAQVITICQSIEANEISNLGFGSAGASNIVLGFWFQASLIGNYSVQVTQTPANAANRGYLISFNVPVASTWYYYSFVIPGDTGGSWVANTTAIGMGVCFDAGAGSNFQSGTVGTWANGNVEHTGDIQLVATNAATMSIAAVRLRSGNADTPWQPRAYEDELRRAKRYVAKTFLPGTVPAQNAGVTGSLTVKNPIALGDPGRAWQFPVAMRVAPTITTYNPSVANANWRDVTAAADVVVSVDPGTAASANEVFIATTGTVTTLGDILAIHVFADADF